MPPFQQKAPTAYLVIRQGGRWSDVFRLPTDRPFVLGRASHCDIVVPDDRTSRRHAEITWTGEHWEIRDLGSRNGTAVDGRVLTGPHPLRYGELIQVTACQATFVDGLAEALPATSDLHPLSDSGRSEQMTGELDGVPTIVQQSGLDPWSMGLALEIAQQRTWQEACEVALQNLLQRLAHPAGGIVRLESPLTVAGSPPTHPRLTILAARERPGKAYHRVSDFLAQSVISDRKGVLARNIQHDPQLHDAQGSQTTSTASVLCVPIASAQQLYGLIHVYSRADEPMLMPPDLETALAVAHMLAAAYHHFENSSKLQKRLQASQHEVKRLRVQLADHDRQFDMIGQSPALQRLRSQLERVAGTQANVLLRGESGVGKEIAARYIHRLSKRADRPFIAINCGALTPSLLESELFGHEKGAFTGATERKLGKFELAHGGTLLLDEVGEMSPEIQVKFLRALEGQPFERVGGQQAIHADVRVIAATNRDLEAAVRQGTFRSDLYFRLRVVEISCPSLRERREDILPIAVHFLHLFRAQSGQGPGDFSPRAKELLLAYSWPGNIRELRNSVERAHVLASGALAEPEDLALSELGLSSANASATILAEPAAYQEKSLEAVERDHILATLQFTAGQKSRAAMILGIERSTLDRKLKRFDQDLHEPGPPS
jgi:transcriptional regulator with GAF, ATPase, and Fis domain